MAGSDYLSYTSRVRFLYTTSAILCIRITPLHHARLVLSTTLSLSHVTSMHGNLYPRYPHKPPMSGETD